MAKVVVILSEKYDTSKFTRFDEETDTKKLGSLYIRQDTLSQLNFPKKIKVTIESADEKDNT